MTELVVGVEVAVVVQLETQQGGDGRKDERKSRSSSQEPHLTWGKSPQLGLPGAGGLTESLGKWIAGNLEFGDLKLTISFPPILPGSH